jgi:hypothetical protein
MRTTLTLDPDVAARLRQSAEASGRPYKQVVNQALRAGLDALGAETKTTGKPFTTPTAQLGTPLIGDLSNVHEALSLAEGDHHR